MKKGTKILINMLASICFAIACITMLSGCSTIEKILSIEKFFISSGDFQYYYIKPQGHYSVVGLTEQGQKKEALIIPPYFKNTVVAGIGYEDKSFVGISNYYTIEIPNTPVQRIFAPFTITSEGLVCLGLYGADVSMFFPSHESLLSALQFGYHKETGYKIYISAFGYQMLEESELSETVYGSYRDHLYLADTAFLFNYESAPNDGYFFINDFERGGKIENTPYEPMREGYAFAGWYKEADCINAWDFERDTLPLPEYDEDGDLIFVETRLYAKWDKV